MPPHQKLRGRRQSDERLRRDREETNASLDDERKETDEALQEVGEASRRAASTGAGHTVVAIEQAMERLDALESTIAEARIRTDLDLQKERLRIATLLSRAQLLASTDSLTELANSRVFMEILTAQTELCRSDRQAFALMYLDLDNFKRINDIFGHVEGDVLLRRISRVIKENIRKEDVAARLGGDEFGILVAGLDQQGVEAIADRVTEEIAALDRVYPGASLGASLGLVYVHGFPDLDETAQDILRTADRAMYEAKANNRKTMLVTLPRNG